MEDSTNKFYFGHIEDVKDERDFKLKINLKTADLPTKIDLRDNLQPIKNQRNLGACTAFATTSLVEFVRNKQKLLKWDASPLFTYYSTRKIEGTIGIDAGAQCRNALKSVVKDGVAKEQSWPYLIERFTENPLDSIWVEAEKHQALVYMSVEQTREAILSCLAEGYPFTFGARLYQSFVNSQTSVFVSNTVPMPDTTTEKLLGGHCMLAVGYNTRDDGKVEIIVRNSWGDGVGLDGYHNFPIEYFLYPNLSFDFWTIRSEESTDEDIPTPPPEPPKPPAPPVPEPPAPTPEPIIPPFEPDVNIWKNPRTYLVLAGPIILAILAYFFKK